MHFFNSKFTIFYKYLLVGCINTTFFYSMFAIFLFFGFHFTLAILAATILSILFNFQSYGKLVFKAHSWNLLGRSIFIYTIIYLLNITLLLAFDLLVSNLYISGAMTTPVIAYLGYILNRRYVWIKS
jgi:putative flippase GtrA